VLSVAVFAAVILSASLTSASEPDAGSAEGEEVEALRTANSSTTELGDGNFETEIYTEPIHYQAPTGDWLEIDNELVDSPKPGYAAENKANAFTAYFPDDLAAEPVRVEAETGESVSYALEGASGAPEVSGETVTYPDAKPGIDLTYRMTPSGVEELITLQNPQAPDSFSFNLEPADGLEIASDGAGATVNDPEGDTVFTVAPPVAYDASGDVEPMTLELTGPAESPEAELTPDPEWLEQAEYPVTVDPTVITPSAGKDCWIGENSTSQCLTDPVLKVGSSGSDRRRSLLNFPVDQIDPDSIITSAFVELYLQGPPSPGSFNVDLHRVTQNWGNDTTWTRANSATNWSPNAGGTFDTAISTNPAGPTVGETESWNATAAVRAWVNQGSDNNGLLLRHSPSAAVSSVINFASSEASVTTQRPKLRVNYTSPLGFVVSAPNSHSATLTWSTRPAGTTGFLIERYDPDDAEWREIDRVPATATSYTDYLLWRNTKYEYRLTALGSAGPVTDTTVVTTKTSSQGGTVPRLYSSSSFWYEQLPQNPVLAQNSQKIINASFVEQSCGEKLTPNPDNSTPPTSCSSQGPNKPAVFDASPNYGMSLAYANPSTTQYTVDCIKCSGADPVFRIPAYANTAVNAGSDRKLAVVDPAAKAELGLQKVATTPASPPSGWSADYAYRSGTQTGLRWDGLQCDGFLGQRCAGPTAAGFSNMGGIVRPEEIKDGIEHALAIMTPFTHKDKMACPGTNTNVDGASTHQYAIPIGARVFLPTGWNDGVIPSAWPEAVRKIAKALQEYGAYVHDTSGAVAIQGENRLGRGYDPWTDPDKLESETRDRDRITLLGGSDLQTPFPWGALKVLKYQLNDYPNGCVDPPVTP